MNSFVIGFLLVSAAALLLVPRRWAPLMLLMGTCYIPFYPEMSFGPFHFNAIRMLIAVGVARVTMRRESSVGEMNKIDQAMLAWSAWMVLSSVFHENGTLVFRLGLVYDACGIYFLIRAFCRSFDDISNVCQLIAILLVPLAVAMFYEQVTAHNVFSVLGPVGGPLIREGRVRASGPFGHPILAGTVGAVCLPLMIGLWRIHRKRAMIGLMACLAIVFASASSGPILSAVAGLWALFMWRYRERVRAIQWLAVAGYVALDIVMKDPAYFLIARIDLAGGSTSWYRARLIQSSIEHISEWWLAGTDYTRHWMWVVVSWSPNHTDITSHYIQMGVYGGLPLLFLFMMVLSKGFAGVTQAQHAVDLSPELRFLVWGMGASLFSHAATMFSVAYFDQSFVFMYIALATISSAWAVVINAEALNGVTASRAPLKERNQVPALGQGALTPSRWVAPRNRPLFEPDRLVAGTPTERSSHQTVRRWPGGRSIITRNAQ